MYEISIFLLFLTASRSLQFPVEQDGQITNKGTFSGCIVKCMRVDMLNEYQNPEK